MIHPSCTQVFGWNLGTSLETITGGFNPVAFNGYPTAEADRNHASFTAINRFLDKGEQTEVCQELTHYRFEIIPGIDSDSCSIQLGSYDFAAIRVWQAVRVASPLQYRWRGTIVNSHGT